MFVKLLNPSLIIIFTRFLSWFGCATVSSVAWPKRSTIFAVSKTFYAIPIRFFVLGRFGPHVPKQHQKNSPDPTWCWNRPVCKSKHGNWILKKAPSIISTFCFSLLYGLRSCWFSPWFAGAGDSHSTTRQICRQQPINSPHWQYAAVNPPCGDGSSDASDKRACIYFTYIYIYLYICTVPCSVLLATPMVWPPRI